MMFKQQYNTHHGKLLHHFVSQLLFLSGKMSSYTCTAYWIYTHAERIIHPSIYQRLEYHPAVSSTTKLLILSFSQTFNPLHFPARTGPLSACATTCFQWTIQRLFGCFVRMCLYVCGVGGGTYREHHDGYNTNTLISISYRNKPASSI